MAAPKGNKFAYGIGRPRVVEAKDLDGLATEMLKWFVAEANGGRLPHFTKFAREVVGCSEDTITNYGKQSEVFSESIKKSKEIQKEVLINGGLAGEFNTTFAIFTAKNITDMRDVVEQKTDIRVTGLENLSDDELDKLITEKQNRAGKGVAGEGTKDA